MIVSSPKRILAFLCICFTSQSVDVPIIALRVFVSQYLFPSECFHYLFGLLWNESSRILFRGTDRLLDWLDCSLPSTPIIFGLVLGRAISLAFWTVFYIVEIHLSKCRELRINEAKIDKLWYCTLLGHTCSSIVIPNGSLRFAACHFTLTTDVIGTHLSFLFEYWFYLYCSQELTSILIESYHIESVLKVTVSVG